MGSQLMPPVMGAVAFIMAETINVPYAEVAKAALIPALLYFGSIYWMVHRRLNAATCMACPRRMPQCLGRVAPTLVLARATGDIGRAAVLGAYAPLFRHGWPGPDSYRHPGLGHHPARSGHLATRGLLGRIGTTVLGLLPHGHRRHPAGDRGACPRLRLRARRKGHP